MSTVPACSPFSPAQLQAGRGLWPLPVAPGRAWTRVLGLRGLSVTLLAPVGELHLLILLTQPSVPADPHQKGHLWGHARAPKLAISLGPAADDKSTVLSSEYQKGERSGGGWEWEPPTPVLCSGPSHAS